MAGTRGLPPSPVIEALEREPHSFDLVQAVRVLEMVGRAQQRGAEPPPAGFRHGEQSAHTVATARFISDTSLRYPGAAITRAQRREDGGPMELTISTMGLIGPLGVLPYVYTTHTIEEQHDNNEALRAFLDIFHHRSVSLFCRASAKYRIALAHEGHRIDQADNFTVGLKSLTGIGSPGMAGRLAFPDDLVLYNGGLFSSQTRPLAALEAVLKTELGQDVRVEPFIGGWVDVPEAEQSRLGGGDAADGGEQHVQLDSSAMIGARAWEAQHHFRTHVGPVDQDGLIAMLPGGARAAMVRDLIQLFCGLEFTFDINVTVKAGSVPAARLCSADDDAVGARLGHTTWVLCAPSPVDRSDAIFSIGSLD